MKKDLRDVVNYSYRLGESLSQTYISVDLYLYLISFLLIIKSEVRTYLSFLTLKTKVEFVDFLTHFEIFVARSL